MAKDASAALGAPQLAGTFVGPRGSVRQGAGAGDGLIGALIAVTGPSGQQAETPAFGRAAYLAVSAAEVALVKATTGLLRLGIGDEVLGRYSRSQVAAAGLKRGWLLSVLTLRFADGDTWSFDVPKTSQRGATQLVQALGGTIS